VKHIIQGKGTKDSLILRAHWRKKESTTIDLEDSLYCNGVKSRIVCICFNFWYDVVFLLEVPKKK